MHTPPQSPLLPPAEPESMRWIWIVGIVVGLFTVLQAALAITWFLYGDRVGEWAEPRVREFLNEHVSDEISTQPSWFASTVRDHPELTTAGAYDVVEELGGSDAIMCTTHDVPRGADRAFRCTALQYGPAMVAVVAIVQDGRSEPVAELRTNESARLTARYVGLPTTNGRARLQAVSCRGGDTALVTCDGTFLGERYSASVDFTGEINRTGIAGSTSGRVLLPTSSAEMEQIARGQVHYYRDDPSTKVRVTNASCEVRPDSKFQVWDCVTRFSDGETEYLDYHLLGDGAMYTGADDSRRAAHPKELSGKFTLKRPVKPADLARRSIAISRTRLNALMLQRTVAGIGEGERTRITAADCSPLARGTAASDFTCALTLDIGRVETVGVDVLPGDVVYVTAIDYLRDDGAVEGAPARPVN